MHVYCVSIVATLTMEGASLRRRFNIVRLGVEKRISTLTKVDGLRKVLLQIGAIEGCRLLLVRI